MTAEAAQKLVAATLVVGGIGGGFYALTGGKSATLEGMHLAKGRELSNDWENIENAYKNEEQNKDLIDGIPHKALKLKEKIKNWCKAKGNTYFIDKTDKTYQSYSTWCLKEISLEKELTNSGLKWRESEGWDKKLEKYNSSFENFLADASPKPLATGKSAPRPQEPTRIEDKNKLKKWCETNKSERFKYIGDTKERQVRLYCYWSDEQIAEANKPQVTEEESPTLSPGLG